MVRNIASVDVVHLFYPIVCVANSKSLDTDPIGSYQIAWTYRTPLTTYTSDLVLPSYLLSYFFTFTNNTAKWGMGRPDFQNVGKDLTEAPVGSKPANNGIVSETN